MRFIRALMLLKRSSIEEMWTGMLPVAEPGQASTPYTAGPHGERPTMGLGFFVVEHGGHRYIYHDGDQGGFSSELLIDPPITWFCCLACRQPGSLHAPSEQMP
jgi:L-ascorbate metabolism protein UlaG (beta-lactamase superfamily)